jgi:ferredoxin
MMMSRLWPIASAAENRIKCKHMDCVEACSVDCFCVGETCSSSIQTNVSIAACAIQSALRRPIVADSDNGVDSWTERNRIFAKRRPNITHKSEPLPDADQWKDKPGKEALFSPEPGK